MAPVFFSLTISSDVARDVRSSMQYLTESIDLPSSAATALAVVSDLGLLLRLSPFWTLHALTNGADGQSEAVLDHYANRTTTACSFTIEASSPQKVSYHSVNGPFSEMTFHIEPRENGIRFAFDLGVETGDESALRQTRQELASWLRSIGEYIKLSSGATCPKRAAKWFMDRVWLRLTLSERNIALIITAISMLEIGLLLVLVLLWRMFVR